MRTTTEAPAASASRRWRQRLARHWLHAAAACLFLGYALTFLYFFVDDEAIPYVYAQNLWAGRGLVYNPADGPVEGYSDFLHVILATGIYGITRLLGWSPLTVFMIGRAISLVSGIATVLVGARILGRLQIESSWAKAAALVPLALAGPLAVWSCSSLEAAPVALTVTLLCYALAGEAPNAQLATVASVILALLRIDGWVWIGGFATGWLVFGSSRQRQLVWRGSILPGAIATLGQALFRVAYFDEWLPMPVYAKVLFKLQDNGQLVTKYPDTSYLAGYLTVTPWPFLALLAGAAVIGLGRRSGRALLLGVALLLVYVNIVGDWMFGFRFLTPLLVPTYVVVAMGVDRLRARSALAAGAATLAISVGAAWSAARFEAHYEHQRLETPRENFWKVRSFERERFFGTYYSLLAALEPLVTPGSSIAYNQAGLIPYALDLRNVDDLGICSRFYAKLPATDVAYTEVGRYEPLNDRPVISARRAYLLRRSPRFLIARTDLLRRANFDRIPDSLFGGYYVLRTVTSDRGNAVYERTSKPASPFRVDPARYLENLAHVSRPQHVGMNGRPLPPKLFVEQLPFLHEEEARVNAEPRFSLHARFASSDVPVQQIYIDEIRIRQPAALTVSLVSAAGVERLRRSWSLTPGSHRINEPLDRVSAAGLAIAIELATPERFRLRDVRVMGRSPELERFVRRELQREAELAVR